MTVTRISAILASLTQVVLTVSSANAEKVKGTETCTAGSYARNIGGKAHTCTKKCTTPVTVTTCLGPGRTRCSSSTYNEIRYEGCTQDAQSQPPRPTLGVTPPAGILETMPLDGGGGRPSPTGQPVRPVAPPVQMIR